MQPNTCIDLHKSGITVEISQILCIVQLKLANAMDNLQLSHPS